MIFVFILVEAILLVIVGLIAFSIGVRVGHKLTKNKKDTEFG
jgi:hypothetical protein